MSKSKYDTTGALIMLYLLLTNGDIDEVKKELEKRKNRIPKEIYIKLRKRVNEINQILKEVE